MNKRGDWHQTEITLCLTHCHTGLFYILNHIFLWSTWHLILHSYIEAFLSGVKTLYCFNIHYKVLLFLQWKDIENSFSTEHFMGNFRMLVISFHCLGQKHNTQIITYIYYYIYLLELGFEHVHFLGSNEYLLKHEASMIFLSQFSYKTILLLTALGKGSKNKSG